MGEEAGGPGPGKTARTDFAGAYDRLKVDRP